ncbi:MAG: U32 family peptidase [Defluviitaleaceae bacterium]|nr:U32 family peptidase [Defluviitaleaceae bacterium]
MKKPELLAPSGNVKTLKAAVEAGADAVYLGAGKFSARAFAGNFDGSELSYAIEYAANADVKVYLAVNTLMTDRELKDALTIVGEAYHAGAAAFIVQDLGLAAEIKKQYPDAILHASTQMTAQTLKDVNLLGSLGFKRVVMARELSRDEIRNIAANTSVELEIFVHGALCSSYSGQCLMSSFIGGRSANRGKCAQPCRLPYKSGKKSGVLLSLKDLCLIDYIDEMADMGVASLKIEGRMKGEDYVRAVVGAYRAVLDGKNLTEKQKAKMLGVFDRGGYTDGYYTGNRAGMYMENLKNPYGKGRKRAD